MAVKLRLARVGKKHAPVYRIVAADSRAPRDGRHIEVLGTYNPLNGSLVKYDADRIDYWVSQGAQPTDTVKRLMGVYKKQGTQAA